MRKMLFSARCGVVTASARQEFCFYSTFDGHIRNSSMNSPVTQFAVACPNCGVGLRVADVDLGQQRDCPQCGTHFTLPTSAEARRAAEIKRRAREQFGFLCRLCGSRIYALPAQIGKRTKCPDCHAINVIQRPPEKLKSKAYDPGDGYEIALADEHPLSSRLVEDQFSFSCRSCTAHLTVPRGWVGRQVPCPDCGLTLIVPFPPPAAKKIVVVAEETGLTLGIAATRPQQETINVDKLMKVADERLAAEAKRRPKSIKRPFLSGVYTYPFYPSSLLYVLLTSFLGGLIITLIKTTIEMQGLEAVVGIILMIAAVLLSLPLIGLVSSYFLKTVHWTSQGFPSVGESPPFEMFEFLRSVAFIVNAFGISTLPGFLIGVVAQNQLLGFGMMLLCAYVFYPFALLSMLDDESIMSFYSQFIFSTLKTQRLAWFKFYVSALLPVGVIVATQVMAFYFPSEAWDYIVVVTGIVALLVYFRLIGRMAYVIDRSIKKTKPERVVSSIA